MLQTLRKEGISPNVSHFALHQQGVFDYPYRMSKGRLEAFSDGVIAILITIMVLELRVPHGTDFTALRTLTPIFLSYVLSFVFLGIYWNNHHHLWQAAKRVNGQVLWANLHLLFWLSLVPFVTGWMGENDFAQLPVALWRVQTLACRRSGGRISLPVHPLTESSL